MAHTIDNMCQITKYLSRDPVAYNTYIDYKVYIIQHYPSLKFEKIGPFKLTRNNKIGEIDSYYKNFEFSMEIKYAQTTGSRQLILVGPRSTANNNDPLIFLYFEESTNKMYIHFWRDGADFQPYVPTNVSKSEFFTWNKKGVHSFSKLHG